MTWSLRIFNGDLVKSNSNSMDVVYGADKVVQDLICWIREPIGTDPVNPQLGTFIEVGEQGQVFSLNDEIVNLPEDFADLVISEIRRVIVAYQRQQSLRFRKEVTEYGDAVTFEDDELINTFSVNYVKNYDTMYITINLSTVDGETYTLDVPVQNDSIIKDA